METFVPMTTVPIAPPLRMTTTDAAACRSIVRAHARTFWLASQLLPAPKRRAAYAVYSFCRLADDIVDRSSDRQSAAAALDSLGSALDRTLGGDPDGPVFRELALAVESYAVPPSLLQELLAGVTRDCHDVVPADWPALQSYCEGVAASVGEMCTYIFGVEGSTTPTEPARNRARTLGVAMQLTNILRDIGEDAAMGRCYLPASDLHTFGITRDEVLAGGLGREPRWKALMQFEVARARALYAAAIPGIDLLSRDSRRCATACAIGYAGILDAIERIGYDTFRARARLGNVERVAVLWTAWKAGLRVQPQGALVAP